MVAPALKTDAQVVELAHCIAFPQQGDPRLLHPPAVDQQAQVSVAAPEMFI